MSRGLIALVTILYGATAVVEAWRGHGGQAMIFAGYTLANVGLLWLM